MTTDNRDRKVLIVAYAFPPMPYVGVHRIVRFCRYLPKNGWRPTVLTLRENSSKLRDDKLLGRVPLDVQVLRSATFDPWERIQRLIVRLQPDPAPCVRHQPISYAARSLAFCRKLLAGALSFLATPFSIPDHQVSWIPFATLTAGRLLRRQTHDLILTTSPPHSSHLIGILLSVMFRRPWVADFRDPILDNFLRSTDRGLQTVLLSLLERLIVTRSSRVICASDHHRMLLIARYKCAPDKCVLVRNGFDPALYRSIVPIWRETFTILHTGTIYGIVTVRFVLRSLARWLASSTCTMRGKLSLVFCGVPPDGLTELVSDSGLTEVVEVRGFVPQDALLPLQLGADMLLLMVEETANSRYVVPAKVFEYVAANRPILGILPEGETLHLLRDRPGFFHVPHEDYVGFAGALNRATSDYLAVRESARSADDNRARDTSEYNAERQVVALATLLEHSCAARDDHRVVPD